ncbi:MAG: hypothetical protein HFJ42_03420 [Clostridia bacterium]|nr:hypothetical protein [Clostridia bacterium]
METKNRIQDLRKECENQVKAILECWLNTKFGYEKKPWRAVEGRKRLRPIPLYLYECNKEWPENMTPDFIRKSIIKLGFIIYPSLNGKGITLVIPEWKEGEKLTWAQEKIRTLNHDYSRYVEDEKRRAQSIFKQLLEELSNYDTTKVIVGDGCIIFKGYKFGAMGIEPRVTISRECYKFIRRLYKEHNMEEYFDNEKYIGLRVFDTK